MKRAEYLDFSTLNGYNSRLLQLSKRRSPGSLILQRFSGLRASLQKCVMSICSNFLLNIFQMFFGNDLKVSSKAKDLV